MKNINSTLLRKLNIGFASVMTFSIAAGLGTTQYALASATSNFTQVINAGTLSADIVDGSYVTVGSPSFALGAATFSFACQTTTGTFGTASQQIYVKNPDSADNGWALSIAAANATDVWDSATSTDFDFNDPTTAGCTDSGDADTVAGQMTINPSVGTLAGGSSAASTTSITKGSSGAFVQGSIDAITLLTAAAGSVDAGDWTLQGVTISQTIPAQQAAASDYDISLVLTVTAS